MTSADSVFAFVGNRPYLSFWVALCMIAGIAIGKLMPAAVKIVRGLEFGQGSQINVPIAVLIWLMITPMMKVDFTSIRNVEKKPTGLLVTLFINWLIKPFSMALLAWAFFRFVFSAIHFRPGSGSVHCGVYHSRRRSLHGNGVRLEPFNGRRPGIHAGSGFCE